MYFTVIKSTNKRRAIKLQIVESTKPLNNKLRFTQLVEYRSAVLADDVEESKIRFHLVCDQNDDMHVCVSE